MAYELRFTNLFDPGRGFCFPCNEQGHVDMDGLPVTAAQNYLNARAAIGHDLAIPYVAAVLPVIRKPIKELV